MKFSILMNPHPLLRKRAVEVPAEEIRTRDFQKLMDDMIETMYAANGIGIAGPQVGQLKRVIIAEDVPGEPLALVNPKIISRSWRKVYSEEGCLSVPGVYGTVRRNKGVTAVALDRRGQELKIKNSKLLAIILQHEIDHLDGVLFIDKAKHVRKIIPENTLRI